MNDDLLNKIRRLKSIADTGLLYHTNEYDKARYTELHEISLQLLSNISGQGIKELKESFLPAREYPTAKVDVRGLLLSSDKKILLVKESFDNNWSLPGGWADMAIQAD